MEARWLFAAAAIMNDINDCRYLVRALVLTHKWCYVGVRKTGDGLGTLDTEEMNGPRLRPMAH